jgi:hypothetical protein
VAGSIGNVNKRYATVRTMSLEALFLVILTGCLIPWMAWISTVLIKIEIRLARGDEKIADVERTVADHEQRIRKLETFR